MTLEPDVRSLADSALATRCLEGDLAAFDVLVDRYRQRVVGLTTRMMGDAGRGEELAQEAFLRAYTRLALYDPSMSFPTWLFRIAVNLCLNRLRKEPTPAEPLDLIEERTTSVDAHPSENPQAAAEIHETQQRVQAAMSSLPPRYRAAVVMRYAAGLDYTEIAKSLDVPIGTVKTNLFRAKEMLRHKLRDLL